MSDPEDVAAREHHERIGEALQNWIATPVDAFAVEMRSITTGGLIANLEGYQWQIADIFRRLDGREIPDPVGTSSILYLEYRISVVEAEIKRRKELMGRKGAPAWPAQVADNRNQCDEIKRRLPLKQFINDCKPVTFEKVGHDLFCRCPLPGHEDKTPSFTVSPDLELFYCFGCKRGGDIFDFAMQFLGESSFHRIVLMLKDEAGIVDPEPTPQQPARFQSRPRAQATNVVAFDFVGGRTATRG